LLYKQQYDNDYAMGSALTACQFKL